ncbi:MAG TPA: hypothetical protein VJT31_11635 [Rugosimonospora sp.]|nr:hypothetical protein [Rugosimonospora sp.]
MSATDWIHRTRRNGTGYHPAGERVLHRDRDTGGGEVLVTDRAIHHRPADAAAWHRLGWEEIHRFRWTPERGLLTLTGLASALALRLPPGSRLPGIVQERTVATVLTASRVALPCGARARISARRRPDSGEIIWVAVFGPGVDPDDRTVQSQLGSIIHGLRTQAGI